MGAHRFYYGKTVSGILYFFTFGLLGVGWIVDLFLIPSMDRDADIKFRAGKYDYSISWLLLTFLGVFGAHRFYLGKFFTGVLYLFTFSLVGLGYLYDLCTLNDLVHRQNSLAQR